MGFNSGFKGLNSLSSSKYFFQERSEIYTVVNIIIIATCQLYDTTQKSTFLIFQEVSPRKLFFLFLSPAYCSLLECTIIRRMKCINRKYVVISQILH